MPRCLPEAFTGSADRPRAAAPSRRQPRSAAGLRSRTLEQLLRSNNSSPPSCSRLHAAASAAAARRPLCAPPTSLAAAPPCSLRSRDQIARPLQADSSGAPVLGASPAQSRALEALIARYTRALPDPRRWPQRIGRFSPILAPSPGFNRSGRRWSIPSSRRGRMDRKVWDVDGNEYVDFVMGFGASLFGHRPPLSSRRSTSNWTAASRSARIQPLAGEVAALVREFTGMRARRLQPIPARRRCWPRRALRARSPAATRSRCSPAPTTASSTRCWFAPRTSTKLRRAARSRRASPGSALENVHRARLRQSAVARDHAGARTRDRGGAGRAGAEPAARPAAAEFLQELRGVTQRNRSRR